MTQTSPTPARTLEQRRDYFREYLDGGVHNVPREIRRQIVDLLSASFIAEVHGNLETAEDKYRTAVLAASRHGLNIEAA